MEKNIPHDSLIKLLMQEQGFPAAFFDTLLPERLKERLVLESLEFSKDSYTDDALQQYFSDAVFNVEYKSRRGNKKMQLALLVEHKSSPE
ncbi:MAG: Rpn family recombination-promoting nuclease/putative transposase, partial [Saprospiraceae bacterium]|nr:Rpn family recombination-promoting nuclease/putative transposase [Saprospiraceae bacterium]